jgi:hypothetical protein
MEFIQYSVFSCGRWILSIFCVFMWPLNIFSILRYQVAMEFIKYSVLLYGHGILILSLCQMKEWRKFKVQFNAIVPEEDLLQRLHERRRKLGHHLVFCLVCRNPNSVNCSYGQHTTPPDCYWLTTVCTMTSDTSSATGQQSSLLLRKKVGKYWLFLAFTLMAQRNRGKKTYSFHFLLQIFL